MSYTTQQIFSETNEIYFGLTKRRKLAKPILYYLIILYIFSLPNPSWDMLTETETISVLEEIQGKIVLKNYRKF
jgi:hypothetical protein